MTKKGNESKILARPQVPTTSRTAAKGTEANSSPASSGSAAPPKETPMTTGKEAPPSTGKAKKPLEKRLYLVTDKGGKEHLVNATSSANANNHVNKPNVRVVKASEVAGLLGKGLTQVEAS